MGGMILASPRVEKRYTFLINPIGKPRVLRGEQSKRATEWRNYKIHLMSIAQRQRLQLPDGFFWLRYYVAPDPRWSEQRQEEVIGQPCRTKPDADNLTKGFFDALYKQDSHFWDYRNTKVFDRVPRIEIYF